MPLLGKGGLPFRIGDRLISVPQTPGCLCCERYSCRPGGDGCQSCEVDPDGEYTTLEECEAECQAEVCIWCVEETRSGPCGEEYLWYRCEEGGCDETGSCVPPSGVIVSGPIKTSSPSSVACFNAVCPDPPPPPPVPECCSDADCGCCRQCVDGYCVDCPPGTTCIECECVPVDQAYYCCQEPECSGECEWEVAQEAPPPFGNGAKFWLQNTYCDDPVSCNCPTPTDSPEDLAVGDTTHTYCTLIGEEPGNQGGGAYCQIGPCAAPLIPISGPYKTYTQCCEFCGCKYACDPNTYTCFLSPSGIYDSAFDCEQLCEPESEFGTCCYTIAPYSDDNNYDNPPAPPGCAIVRGCFGIMSFQECMALGTETGTTTYWNDDFLDCDLCPITASHVCCYPDPDDPCETLCHETSEECCEDMGGKDYTALRTCDERWPSGLSACRTELNCEWPAGRDEWVFGAPLQIREQFYSTAPRRFDDPPCIQNVQWNPGYPEALQNCYRWVRDLAKCEESVAGQQHPYRKFCVRYRLMKLEGDAITDITAIAIANPGDLDCCQCERNLNWADCNGQECEPLPFFPDPEANCPP
jgi:hypothetical protein